jgi:hypothetical protein
VAGDALGGDLVDTDRVVAAGRGHGAPQGVGG